ncbi:MAG TPA: crotonase/enoyl-CoA hydratase family protein [Candidatus Deferrimicrobiaceae bacterium]|jgi:DSF synthase
MAGCVLQFPVLIPHLSQVRTLFDDSRKTMWTFMAPSGRQCFNERLLDDLVCCYGSIRQHNQRYLRDTGECPIRYAVVASANASVFSYGGDIALFRKLIVERDRGGLTRYAMKCIDLVHTVSVNCDLPMSTIALVQGEALGGGFEAALSASYLVAEKRARFALPEILFNLFPGMGAYQFLARRLRMKQVEEIVTSGNVYTAAELYEMGVVDVLAEDGEGELAVHEFVREHSRRSNARHAIGQVRQEVFSVTRESLVRTVEIWVETALRLTGADLRVIDRLVRAQVAKTETAEPGVEADRAGG